MLSVLQLAAQAVTGMEALACLEIYECVTSKTAWEIPP